MVPSVVVQSAAVIVAAFGFAHVLVCDVTSAKVPKENPLPFGNGHMYSAGVKKLEHCT